MAGLPFPAPLSKMPGFFPIQSREIPLQWDGAVEPRRHESIEDRLLFLIIGLMNATMRSIELREHSYPPWHRINRLTTRKPFNQPQAASPNVPLGV